MSHQPNRRDFFRTAGAGLAAGLGLNLAGGRASAAAAKPLFTISLAQWSLNKVLFGRKPAMLFGGEVKKLDNLDFAKAAKVEFGIDAVEFVNQFFKDKATDEKYLAELKKRSDDNGVSNVLIMCDGEGNLGDPDDAKRATAVTNHHKWVTAAKFLGCHSIRVNAATGGKGTPEEQAKRAADGLAKLTEFGAKHEINVIVENHGGLSSDGAWLAGVIKSVGNPRCGTLPDFGNFRVDGKTMYDRYKGVDELMPFAKGVSAKSHDFNEAGDEIHTDYRKMLKIVVADHKWRGRIGIEYEGGKISEPDGIKATKKLLEKVRDELAATIKE